MSENKKICSGLSASSHCHQGGKKRMEDKISVMTSSPPETGVEYSYFGVFDGHGGPQAAAFAKQHLLRQIVSQPNFQTGGNDDDKATVLKAIRDGFVSLHEAMQLEWTNSWPLTRIGSLSTAGTTASITFIKSGQLFVGHLGDSAIVLGYQDHKDDPDLSSSSPWKAKKLTEDHKPYCPVENKRIEENGGKVALSKTGVQRVVWNRVRRVRGSQSQGGRSNKSRKIVEEIPFLAIARSLGDYWSYNPATSKFVVSPVPDTFAVKMDSTFRCLIIASDGLWDVMKAQEAVDIVLQTQLEQVKSEFEDKVCPSTTLVQKALRKWEKKGLEADNISAITIIFK